MEQARGPNPQETKKKKGEEEGLGFEHQKADGRIK
jgi:hypothetical protein